MALAACSGQPAFPQAPQERFAAGTYTAAAQGYNGEVTVEVTVDGQAILSVQVTGHQEDAAIAEGPIREIPAAIVAGQTLAVQAVSGATLTSRAILEAAEGCLRQAGADIDALKAPAVQDSAGGSPVEKTADVVVVGGGAAGMAAALSAAENGASVLLVERGEALGGSAARATLYNCPDPARQEPAGVGDSPALFARQTWEGGDRVANLELVTLMSENAYAGLQWLQQLGAQFEPGILQGAGALYPRSHRATRPLGETLAEACQTALQRSGCEILLQTQALSLRMEEGRVTGVDAVGPSGAPLILHAGKQVIMATGGFAANEQLLQQYAAAEVPVALCAAEDGATGQGLLMCQAAGAHLTDMQYLQLLPWCDPGTGQPVGASSPLGVAGAIFINRAGERFVREDGRLDEISAALLQQAGASMYVLQNSASFPDLAAALTPEGAPLGQLLAQGAHGWVQAGTLEELAAQIGVPARALAQTVADYNAAVDSQRDPLGRTLLTTRLDGGPWYAYPCTAAVCHTLGGVQIDARCHALRADGTVIEGLLCAGGITGGIHGANSLGGNALTQAVVFGRIAGQTAAQ